jgi:hypothetical protein
MSPLAERFRLGIGNRAWWLRGAAIFFGVLSGFLIGWFVRPVLDARVTITEVPESIVGDHEGSQPTELCRSGRNWVVCNARTPKVSGGRQPPDPKAK